MKSLVLGIMSGTSLDGVDLALCEFESGGNRFGFQILDALTKPYSDDWFNKLAEAPKLSGVELLSLHNEYGRYLGGLIISFLKGKPKPNLIASHGHTVFHQPEVQLTFQLGNGASIAAETGIDTVCDFRNLDVALGGQGAPLVPLGDQLLFPEFQYCLNLGGFSNISFAKNEKRIAFDISPVNIVLNYFATQKLLSFDRDGLLGQQGKVDLQLLQKLNDLPFYRQMPPKSLGREWVDRVFLPVVDEARLNFYDSMATIYEHIAIQIGSHLSGSENRTLVTGGGARNRFLMERIQRYSEAQIIVPESQLVDFKEALIFAFLGLLHSEGFPSALASVTGARYDNRSAVIYRA